MHGLLQFKKRTLELFRVKVVGLRQSKCLEVGAVSNKGLNLAAGAEEVAAAGGFPAGPAGGQLVRVRMGMVVLAGADFFIFVIIAIFLQVGPLMLAVRVAAAERGRLVRVVVVCCGGKASRS